MNTKSFLALPDYNDYKTKYSNGKFFKLLFVLFQYNLPTEFEHIISNEFDYNLPVGNNILQIFEAFPQEKKKSDFLEN